MQQGKRWGTLEGARRGKVGQEGLAPSVERGEARQGEV